MPLSTRYYETLYGVQLSTCSQHWGRITYEAQLVKEYPHLDTSTVTSVSVNTGVEFIYPFQIDKEYAIEGVISGQATIFNFHPTAPGRSFNKNYDAELLIYIRSAVESKGIEEAKLLARYRLPAIFDVPNEDYVVIPFYIDMTNRVYINPAERLTVKLTSPTVTDTEILYCFAIDTTNEEFKIKIPFV